MKQIIIDVSKDGDVVLTTKGFTGTACLTATAELERALFGKPNPIKTTKTAEFHKQGSGVTSGY